MEQFNNQFATQNLLQEQQGPFYVVYNKGYGQGKGVANDFKSFPSFEAAQAFADEANDSTGGTFSKFQKYYYVVGSDHEDFEWISQAAHDKAGLDKEIGETLNEVKFTIDDSDLYSAVMDRYMRGASVQDMLIKDEGDYLETDEETFQGIQAIAMDLDKVDALIRLDGIEETSTTSGAGAYLPKATVKKKTDEVKKNKKDVEPKLAAGEADIYMKDKWGWKEAPSIPNRPSKGGFMYKQLFENHDQGVPTVMSFYYADPISPEDQSKVQNSVQDTISYLKGEGYNVDRSMALYFPNFTWAAKNYGPATGFLVGSGTIVVTPVGTQKVYKISDSIIAKKISTGDLEAYRINLSQEIKENYSEGDYVKILDPESRLYGMKAHIHDIHDDGTALVILDEPKKTPTTVDLSKLRKVELNENYSRFKKETKTRTNEQQLHTAMRLAEKKIHEANRILEYTAQLRTELNETKVNKNTQKLMEKITRGIAEAYGKMKKLK